MKVRTSHRTEVELSEAEWFRASLRTGSGEMQVRRITAQWSSDQPLPVLTFAGVRVLRSGVSEDAEQQMLWAWRQEDRDTVRQIPAPVHVVLEAIGIMLP